MKRNFKFPIGNWQLLTLVAIILLATILRFYKLGTNPSGLYWDEAAFGYDAYSILKTSRDHHGQTLPLFFESFGDWKLPVYHYLIVPSITVFGLNEFAVRFPSASLGALTVLVFFLLVRKLTQNINLSLLSAFILTISPWHLQFSRGGFESTAGLFFVVLGVYLFLFLVEDRKTKHSFSFFLPATALASAGFFTLSMYSYHAFRIFTPLIIAALFLIYFSEIKRNLAKVIFPAILALILFLPLLVFTFSPDGRARAISQTAFHHNEFEAERIRFDQSSKRPLRFLSKYWWEPFYYSYKATSAYIDHFSPTFLFFRGDQIGRHSLVEIGQIFGFEIILLSASLFAIKKLNQKTKLVMVAWLLLSPISAMIVTPTPHAYRTLQMSLPLAFFSAVGLNYLFSQKFLLIKLGLILIISYSLLTYWHLRFIHYPRIFASDWQDGYRQMVHQVKKFENQFDRIYITDINQVPYIYFLFYGKYDPNKYIAENGTRDAFGKYVFVARDVNLYNKGRILYVAPSWEKVDGTWLAAANDSAGRHIYSLWEVNGPFDKLRVHGE